MNANKLCLALALLCVLSATAVAQNAAPALYGIKEFAVQNTRLGDEALTTSCGMTSGEISTFALKALVRDSLPAFSVIDAPAKQKDSARIDLWPALTTIKADEKTCTSWIELSAQSRELVILPPLEAPRHVTVTYWTGGLLVHSTIGTHSQAVINALDKLVGAFSRQYWLDQPPLKTRAPLEGR